MNATIEIKDLLSRLSKVKGGYEYMGACSTQICFPLRNGGELRFSLTDDDCNQSSEGDIQTECGVFNIDLYDGAIPPGVSGPATLTGRSS